ncbi:MAG: sensor histidine kinase [Vulcanimicrobiaceae bacterium]
MFRSFGARITRGYVLLAIALILLVTVVQSTVTFVLYASTLNEGINNATERVTARARAYSAQHETIAQFAPKLVQEVGHGRTDIAVFDANRHLLAGEDPQRHHSRVAGVIATLLGVRPEIARIPGGAVLIMPDVDRLSRSLLQYWAIMPLVAVVAAFIAWLVGRRITHRAIGPLADVTQALHRIAGGEFRPQPLSGGDELRDLTTAYNDVAHRLTAETAERERTQAQMRQFIADAGHELRTPLTVVMGYIDALKNGVVRDPDGIAHVYQTMLDESRRMRTVIEKLILLARLERPAVSKTEPVHVAGLTQRAVDELAPFAENRLRLDVATHAVVESDPGELYEAVKNVIDNALKYAPGSSVSVTLARRDGNAELQVADDGPGMTEQDLTHAFDRFYRGEARTQAEGSGLGLAIAKRAVERSGGRVAIESAPGRGTRVIMTLPLSHG